MKRNLAVLLAIATICTYTSAQSSVTIFGTVDLSGKYVKNDGSSKRLSLAQDGLNNSQLVFRGVEDLGGGAAAGFTLNAGTNPDTGTANSKFFNRRSTVSLFGPGGEVRLGRDYTPTYWNQTIFDALGTVGLGGSLNVAQLFTGTTFRADNSVGYFLPAALGGFYGQVMAAAAEGGVVSATASNPGRYLGARIGYSAGPFNIAGAAASQRYVFPSGFNVAGGSQKTYNIGASYLFGTVKLMAYIDRERASQATENRGSISTVIPFGQSELHFGYERSRLSTEIAPTHQNTVWQAAATYQYNLSKRTAVYSTVSMLKNSQFSNFSTASGGSITAPPTPGGKSKGFEAGIRHFF